MVAETKAGLVATRESIEQLEETQEAKELAEQNKLLAAE